MSYVVDIRGISESIGGGLEKWGPVKYFEVHRGPIKPFCFKLYLF